MLQNFFRANRPPHGCRRALSNLANAVRPARLLLTSLLDSTKTLTMVFTSVPSAQTKSNGTRRCGLVGLAGPFSTSAASRNGLPTKAQQQPASKHRAETCHLHVNGDVQAAIFRKTSFQNSSPAGVRRRSIPSLSQAYPPSPAGTHAQGTVCSRRNAHIPAQSCAMLDLVHHAHKWDLRSFAFAERSRRLGGV